MNLPPSQPPQKKKNPYDSLLKIPQVQTIDQNTIRINNTEYTFDQQIGKGSSGEVFRYLDNQGNKIALKSIKINNPNQASEIFKEIQALQFFNNIKQIPSVISIQLLKFNKQTNSYEQTQDINNIQDIVHINYVMEEVGTEMEKHPVFDHSMEVLENFLIQKYGQQNVESYGVFELWKYLDINEKTQLNEYMHKEVVLKTLPAFDDISQGIDLLHNMNPPIVFRDIKPENATMTQLPNGDYKGFLIDIGSAVKAHEQLSGETFKNFLARIQKFYNGVPPGEGTNYYMDPLHFLEPLTNDMEEKVSLRLYRKSSDTLAFSKMMISQLFSAFNIPEPPDTLDINFDSQGNTSYITDLNKYNLIFTLLKGVEDDNNNPVFDEIFFRSNFIGHEPNDSVQNPNKLSRHEQVEKIRPTSREVFLSLKKSFDNISSSTIERIREIMMRLDDTTTQEGYIEAYKRKNEDPATITDPVLKQNIIEINSIISKYGEAFDFTV